MRRLIQIGCFLFLFPVIIYGQTDSAFKKNNSSIDSSFIVKDSLSNAAANRLTAAANKMYRAVKMAENSRLKGRKDSFLYKSIGWTNDFERIFSKKQIEYLDSVIATFEMETSVEITIVTIDSSFVGQRDFDSLVISIGKTWKVGKRDKDNGIVIGISSSLRKIRISNGYGIEAKLSDIETKKIIDEEILPAFRQANYFEGVRNGITAIMQKLR